MSKSKNLDKSLIAIDEVSSSVLKEFEEIIKNCDVVSNMIEGIEPELKKTIDDLTEATNLLKCECLSEIKLNRLFKIFFQSLNLTTQNVTVYGKLTSIHNKLIQLLARKVYAQ